MTTIFILLVSLAVRLFDNQVSAQMTGPEMMAEPAETEARESEHGRSLDQVLADLLANYRVETLQELECDRLTDLDLERLGEAWMGYLHPDEEVHARMDEMMGGEGSESLQAMHRQMGESYLGCGVGRPGMMAGMGMMRVRPGLGGGETGMMMGWNGPGMGGPFWGGGFGWLTLTSWILVLVLLVVAIRYLWQKGSRS